MAAFWEKVKPGTVMKDRFGNFVTVFSPGRKNKNEGPDFLDAVIWVNGEMIKGAVEIHSHESYWISHGDYLPIQIFDCLLTSLAVLLTLC